MNKKDMKPVRLIEDGYTLVDFGMSYEEFQSAIRGSKIKVVYNTGKTETIKYWEFDFFNYDNLLAFKLLRPCKLSSDDQEIKQAQKDLEMTNEQLQEAFNNTGANEAIRKIAIEHHPLYSIFMAAIEQLMYGKGERHGGVSVPFLDQPWKSLADQHGIGFLSGQSAKKIGEAIATKTGDDRYREVLGAVNYAGMTALYHAMQAGKDYRIDLENKGENPGVGRCRLHSVDDVSTKGGIDIPISDEFKVKPGDVVQIAINGELKAGVKVPDELSDEPFELLLKIYA